MKNIFVTDTKYLNNNLALLVARIAIAVLMLSHGLPKLQMLFSGGAIDFPVVLGMNAELSLSLTVFAEVVCSVFILFGFGTRLATVPLMITMLVAVFAIHAGEIFAKKELAVFYLVGYVVLFVAGSGKYSIDQLLQSEPRVKYNSQVQEEDPTISFYQ
jgi:putative oxidoreductase